MYLVYIQPFSSLHIRTPPVTSAHIQIVHARGNHWVAVTNIGCASKVLVFDSLYSSVDKETLKLVTTIFGRVDIEMGVFSQQYGATDCGLFSIAVCVALANKQQPGRFAQGKMRAHLVTCFENLSLTPFP